MNPIALMFALIAGAVLMPVLYTGIANSGAQTMATATALQMAHVRKAAEGYISTYAANLEAASTATAPAVITVPMLVSTGFLPQGFGATNPYGQTWQVQVLQPSAGKLQALALAVGGNAVPAKDLNRIAATAGNSGGVIGGGAGQYAVPGCNPGQACGAYGGWRLSTAGYQNVAAAHPAALIMYANGQVQNSYLYRVAVPGQPQLNTMQTNLDMGNNDVGNARNVSANGNLTVGGDTVQMTSGWNKIISSGTLHLQSGGNNPLYLNPWSGAGEVVVGGGGAAGNLRALGSLTVGNHAFLQRPATIGAYPMTVMSVGNEWNNQERTLLGLGADGISDMYTRLYSWDRTAAGVDTASTGNYFQIGSNGNSYTPGSLVAGANVQAGGSLIPGYATAGTACASGGAIAQDALGTGKPLTCQGGVWRPLTGGAVSFLPNPAIAYPYYWPNQNNTYALGFHDLCALNYLLHDGTNGGWCYVYKDTNAASATFGQWLLNAGKWQEGGVNCQAVCVN